MSANLLSEESETVGITDELESFFYVILYYSARYLQSNITDVRTFIEAVFDDFRFSCGEYRIGPRKSSTITNYGSIGIPPLFYLSRLHFSTPLDEFFHELRHRFVSLYKVRDYESQKPLSPNSPSSTNLSDPLRTLPKRPPRLIHNPLPPEVMERVRKQREAISERREDPRTPTQDDRTRAAEAADYDYMLWLLQSHIQVNWPRADNQGDLIAAHSQSKSDSDREATAPSIQDLQKGQSPSVPPVMDAPPADEPAVVVGKEVEEKKRGTRTSRVQRQGVRRSARVANKA